VGGQLQNKLDQGKIESLVQQLRAFPECDRTPLVAAQ
jgi:hypothetical protein